MIHLKEFGAVYKSNIVIDVQKFIIKNFNPKHYLRLRHELMNYITVMMNSNGLTYEKPISVSLKLDEDIVMVELIQGISPRYEYTGSIRIKTS